MFVTTPLHSGTKYSYNIQLRKVPHSTAQRTLPYLASQILFNAAWQTKFFILFVMKIAIPDILYTTRHMI
jgi:hypothetical protein